MLTRKLERCDKPKADDEDEMKKIPVLKED